ncbi:MAG: hypothetical protein N7Q72_07255, partial [Spiroplasma sp. Tabriz.8]|nr:hypothetical protein [Spiroplasma sp. Tabriz.8]
MSRCLHEHSLHFGNTKVGSCSHANNIYIYIYIYIKAYPFKVNNIFIWFEKKIAKLYMSDLL